jgi:chaperonin GroES
MKLKPLHDKVLIAKTAEDEKTEGGIIIPDTVDKERSQEGKVVAVGSGKILDDGSIKPLDVKKGDKVVFGKYGGAEIGIEGVEYIILREDEILAVID